MCIFYFIIVLLINVLENVIAIGLCKSHVLVLLSQNFLSKVKSSAISEVVGYVFPVNKPIFISIFIH